MQVPEINCASDHTLGPKFLNLAVVAPIVTEILLNELMPFIQETYRIERGSGRTGIAAHARRPGKSLSWPAYAGNIWKIAALSPSVWWNHRVHACVSRRASMPEPRRAFWLDVGTREGPRIVDDRRNASRRVDAKSWRLGENLHYQRVEGAEHNEPHGRSVSVRSLSFCFPAG